MAHGESCAAGQLRQLELRVAHDGCVCEMQLEQTESVLVRPPLLRCFIAAREIECEIDARFIGQPGLDLARYVIGKHLISTLLDGSKGLPNDVNWLNLR